MKRIGRILATSAALAFVVTAIGSSPAQAVEAILNGGLENSVGPRGWVMTQTITGMPGSPINAVEHVDLADNTSDDGMTGAGPNGLGLYMRPFQGNLAPYEGENKAINVTLTQTTASATAGRTYTLTGHSYFQLAASNNVDTLFADSPSGAVPSPTETYFQMEWLNSSGAVIGSPVRLDLPRNRATDMLPADYLMHSVMGVAPTGTARIRVTAAAENMVASCTDACPGGQDVYFDNFTLRDSFLPTAERLQVIDGVFTGSLDIVGAPENWVVEKTAQDNIQFSSASYAIHTGNTGMWLRSFSGGDAKILQTIAAVPGEDYSFSGWSKWEAGYLGADPVSATETFLRMEFLDSSSMLIGSPITLDLKRGSDGDIFTPDPDQQQPDDVWREFFIDPTEAPLGTAFVRVSAGATGMGFGLSGPQSAMFDDFSLITTAVPGLPGDFNDDGKVDAADYVVFRKFENTSNTLPNDNGIGGMVGAAHYNLWVQNFGEMAAGSGSAGTAAVPEPSTVMLFGMALGLLVARRSGGHNPAAR